MAHIQGEQRREVDKRSTMGLPHDEIKTLERIQERVLWLSTRMIDHANRERENLDGLKVGAIKHRALPWSL